MPEQFIYPNWHVIILHSPLGLLGVGVVLEWLSHCWPRSAIRTGARWMILMGALLAIPTTTLGIYAFRDVVTTQQTVDLTWRQVVEQSHWSDVQWHYMIRHIWYEAIGTGLAVLAVLVWLAGSDEARRKLYWPGLLVVTAALACMVVGGWYSGESVYRHGTAVAAAMPEKATEPLQPVAPEPAAGEREQEVSGTAPAIEPAERSGHEEHEHKPPAQPAWVQKYFPPIQVHLLMVGATLGFAIAAIGLSIRRWSQPYGPLPASRIPPPPTVRPGQPVSHEPEIPGQPIAPAPAVLAPPTVLLPIFPARFWLAALIFAALTAVGGLWMTGDWKLEALLDPLRSGSIDWKHDRLFWHVIFGVSIAVCTLILAIATRVSRRAKFITILFVLLLLLAVAGQLWIGILMLYDSPQGPVTCFSS
jgi:hypothetical protein